MSRSNSTKRARFPKDRKQALKDHGAPAGYCTGPNQTKRGYATKSQAKSAIKRGKRVTIRGDLNNSTPARPVRPYRCRHCGYWHVTSRPLA